MKLRLYLWDTQVPCFKLERVIASGGIRVTRPGASGPGPSTGAEAGLLGSAGIPGPGPCGGEGPGTLPEPEVAAAPRAVTRRPLRAHSEEGAGPSTF